MTVYLETERLVLRRLATGDAQLLWELDQDPLVTRYLTGGAATPYEQIRDHELPFLLAFYAEHPGLGWWAAEERASGLFIGWFHLKPDKFDDGALEIGYRLKRSSWGKGFATEVTKALVQTAFEELNASRVTAYTRPENTASIRVMEKAGLRFECRFVSDAPGKWRHGRETVAYGLTRSEYEDSGDQ